jgi:predicted ATPase
MLYGRDADLTALRSLIDGHRLVTVVGAGGIGKSCLALSVAHSLSGRWPDGAWLVELAGLSDPALVPNVVAQALHVLLPGQGPALDELVAGLAQRTLLLVLDNCEHLLEAVAALAQAITHQAPGVMLLATSQEPLRLPAEQQYRVAPLAIPSGLTTSSSRAFGAVALFEARVRAVDPKFTLNDESLSLVIDICRRLDGLPLAIELAAARVGTLGLRPARDKLDARFKLLTGGSRATLRRHQTLRAALEWSYNLLDVAEQVVFRRLGVFAGGFTMELAQAVAGDAQLDEWAVLDHLSALVDKSLVVAEAGDTPRYRLLESARAFALEQLAASETAETLRRHALAMRDFMQRIDGANLDCELRSDQYAALVLPELDNLRAAYAWATGESGDLNVAVAIAAHSGSLIDYAVECVDWLMPLLPHVEGGTVDPAVAARFWRAIAASNMVGHVLRTVQLEAAVRALSMYRESGQPRRVVSCLLQVARHRLARRDAAAQAAAQAAVDEARGIVGQDWPAEFRILLLRADGSLAGFAGRRSERVAIRREAVRVSVSSGDWRHEVIDRSNLVDTYWEDGSIDEAASEARKLAAELRVRPAADSEMAMHFANLIGILSEMGRIDEASAVAREAIPILRRARYTYIEEWVYLFWRRGQFDTAARLLGASDAERARFGTPHQANEQRLIDAARAGLAARLPADAFTRALAAGAALDEREWLTVVSEALARAGEGP